jgi:hypothetical protein
MDSNKVDNKKVIAKYLYDKLLEIVDIDLKTNYEIYLQEFLFDEYMKHTNLIEEK